MPNTKGTREQFGNVRRLPSGRYQARWRRNGRYLSAKGADGGALTFPDEQSARDWLESHRELIARGVFGLPTGW